MKWYLLVLVFYISFWAFLGWGIRGAMWGLMVSLSLFLISGLIAVFNFKNKFVKEALCLLYVPSALVYATVKFYGSMSMWRMLFIIIAALIQGTMLFFYFRAKRKKKKEGEIAH